MKMSSGSGQAVPHGNRGIDNDNRSRTLYNTLHALTFPARLP
jgi:hypothetical protein